MYAHIKKYNTTILVVFFLATVPVQSVFGMDKEEKKIIPIKSNEPKTLTAPIKMSNKSKKTTSIPINNTKTKIIKERTSVCFLEPKNKEKTIKIQPLRVDHHNQSLSQNKINECIEKIHKAFQGTEEEKKFLSKELLVCEKVWRKHYKIQKEENFLRDIEKEGIKIKNQFLMFILAHCYQNGIEMPINIQKAISLYSRASKFGSLLNESVIIFVQEQAKTSDESTKRRAQRCLNNLGHSYLSGQSGTKDEKKGIEYLQLASDLGYFPATYNLGFCYHFGKGVGIDLEKARELYREAAEGRFKDAIEGLKLLNENK